MRVCVYVCCSLESAISADSHESNQTQPGISANEITNYKINIICTDLFEVDALSFMEVIAYKFDLNGNEGCQYLAT